jgi:hypothetical protein
MRGLVRNILAFFTMGLTVTACNQAGSPDNSGKDDTMPYHATFRVPGLT